MTTLDRELLGEVARVTCEEVIRRPTPVRDRWGRWHRDPSGEYDWYYGLSELERAYVSRFYMASAPRGVEPDVIASMSGNGYVDDWAEAFIADVRAARNRKRDSLDVLDDSWAEYADQPDDDDELMGPDEVAALLAVKRNTLAQWRHRGKLPEPCVLLSGLPIWRKGDVMAFAVDTGREVLTEVE